MSCPVRVVIFLAVALVCSASCRECRADELSDALKSLSAVGPDAAGHRAAQAAWRTAAKAEAARLPELLAALDTAGPLAANWIRSAVETIGERAETAGDKSAVPAIEKFVLDVNHAPQGRRLAYELLAKLDKTAPERLMPGFLNDPSTELRREAIDRLLATGADSKDADVKKAILEKAFAASRDVDQIKDLADKVEKAGGKADLPKHFGFITTWKIIGPFDNTKEKGYDVAYPPESEIKLDAKYKGKGDKEVAWIDHTTTDKHGIVDLNAVLGKTKGAAAYALAEIISNEAGGSPKRFDIRVGSGSAIKVWINGKQVDARNVYHSGFEIDQYISHAEIAPDKVNRVLIKVCENEQTESWAQDWKFQLRICDSVGTPIVTGPTWVGK